MSEPKMKTVIGLEIHAQLNTKRKMFCGCNNQSFAEATDGKQRLPKKPNSVVCPRCLGMPGTLPVANHEALVKVAQIGLVFKSKINPNAKFDRKHYFYPDLPKGYQISQYDQPICLGGEVEIETDNGKKTIRLNRIHLEEDAGKLTHPNGQDYTLVDLNRASTPLAEMVSEPDIASPEEAKAFMKVIQAELVNQGISDADMEKGHLRCDANISIVQSPKSHAYRQAGKVQRMSEIVEVKNINSFRFVEKALTYEEKRLQEDINNWPDKRTKVTRGFDSQTGETYAQRHKEESAEYRYFPEPDLPPINAELLISDAKSKLKETIPAKRDKLIKETSLSASEVMKILTSKTLSEVIWPEIGQKYLGALAKLLVHTPELATKNRELLINYSKAITEGTLSVSLAKQKIIEGVPFSEDSSAQVETGDIQKFISTLVQKNQDIVNRFKDGNTKLLGFFVGQVMNEYRGKIEPKVINQIILKELNK